MRVAVLMSQASPWAREIATSLAAQGCRVDVISFPIDARGGVASLQNDEVVKETRAFRERVASFHELRVPGPRRLRYVLAAPALRRVLRRVDADVLLTLYGGGQGLASWLSGFRPYVVWLMGSDVLLAGPIQRLINGFVFRGAARVFANGGNLAQRAEDQAPGVPVRSLLVGIDSGTFTPGPKGEPPTLVCTRSFEDVYENGVIVRALALLPPATPRFKMVFVSSGDLLDECVKLADELLTPDRRSDVTFAGGMSFPELVGTVASGDVYLSMSRSDGTSTGLMEGLACGLIPVVSDIPANREWVDPGGGGGFLVPVGDARGLAAALQTVLADLARYREDASGNRDRVVALADATVNRTRLLEELTDFVAHGGRGRGTS